MPLVVTDHRLRSLTRASLCGMAAATWLMIGTAAPAREPAPGGGEVAEVEYRHLVEPGPQSIGVVSFDMARTDLALTATVGEFVRGNETVPEMVGRLPATLGRPLAAINGDFFELSGEPRYVGTVQGMCVEEGEMVTAPRATAFWIDRQGRPRLGRVTPKLQVVWPDGSQTPFGINCSTADFKSEVQTANLVLYTPRFGRSTQTTAGTREWVLQPAAADTAWLPLPLDGEVRARVGDVRQAGDAPIPAGGMVLSASRAAAATMPPLAVGDGVTLRIGSTPDMAGVRTAIGGSPILLADGALLTKPGPADGKARAPRSAIGLAGSRVWLVVVDGRRPGTAIGMTHHELAQLMQRLGCTDAMNLDGGGSSTLVYDGRIVNTPSDGRPRPVGNALVLLVRR